MSAESYAMVIDSIRKCIPKPLQKIEITPHSQLREDLGIDSLTLMIITVELEKSTGIKLNAYVEQLVQARTVEDIEKLVSSLEPQTEITT